MSDVFISYNRNDRARVEGLVDLLRKEGFDVWWDQDISPGAEFVREIEKQIKAAKCVVVVWSKTSCDRGWVLTEADYANTQGKLIPVLFDEIEIPFAFRLVQTADLISWKPNQFHPGISQVLKAISLITGRAVISKPAELQTRIPPRSAYPTSYTEATKVTPDSPTRFQQPQQVPIQAPKVDDFPNEVKVHWKLSLPGEVHEPPIMGSDGAVYLITRNGALVCVNNNGKTQWSTILGGGRGIGGQGLTLSPLGNILAVTDSYVNCVSSNGTKLWQWTQNGGVTTAPTVGSDGTVYVMTNKSTLWAVSINGETIWSRQLCQVFGGGSWPSPAYSNVGVVYAACKGRYVFGVNPENGDLLWEFATNDAVAASPVVGSDGTGYFASNAGWVFAIKPSGQQLWVTSVSGGSGRISMIDAPLAISNDDTLLVAPRHGKIYAIAPSGDILWDTAVGGQGTGNRPAAASPDGRVYAATTSRELFGLTANGQKFLKLSSEKWFSAPMVGPDNTLYIGIGTNLLALHVDIR